jgi:hypothetical protein
MDFWWLILGWLLGLLSPGIAERINRKYRKSDFMATVFTELGELQLKMALVAYRLHRRGGSLNEERLTLIGNVVRQYSGPEEDKDSLAAARQFFSQPLPGQLAEGAEPSPPHIGVRVIKYYAPFLESQVQGLSICPLGFQQAVMQIDADLRIFNDGVDFYSSQFEKTFDSSLAANNRNVVQDNIDRSYDDLARRSERIVREIDHLCKRYPG